MHLWHGRLAGVPYPIIPGHVSVGTLAKARGEVIGARAYALDQLNEALADAEAMRLPKALVDPRRRAH